MCPSLDIFMNISFKNPELCLNHLYLHAPKLDLKGAAGQLLGAFSLSSLSSELMEADFGARSNWPKLCFIKLPPKLC